jgi:hypothetical protein
MAEVAALLMVRLPTRRASRKSRIRIEADKYELADFITTLLDRNHRYRLLEVVAQCDGHPAGLSGARIGLAPHQYQGYPGEVQLATAKASATVS